MQRRSLVAATVALAAAVAVPPARGFECAPLAPSTTRTPAYRLVSGQQLCEGFFARPVSQPFVELVSLTRGAAPVAASSPTAELALQVQTRGAARLVVQPQRSSPNYRVDAALPAGQALRWNPSQMLAATGLRLADLGFLAPVEAAVVPTGVAALAPVALDAGSGEAHRATAVLRVSVAVASLAWRSYRADAGAAGASPWVDLPDSRLFAWQRLALPIDLPADGRGLLVDVQAVGADDGRALPLLRFAIVGPRDGGP